MSDQAPIPVQQAVTPHLCIRGCAKAIDWYKEVFGAVEFCRMPGEDGRLMHAMIGINGSNIMLCDEFLEYGGKGPEAIGGTPVTLHHHVKDVDAVFKKAVEQGATAKMPPQDMFWGDRYGILIDPFGHSWSLATTVKKMSFEDMQAAAKEMSKGPCPEAEQTADAAKA